MLDEKRIVQYANQDSLDLLGFKMEEQFLGSNFDLLISPDQLSLMVNSLAGSHRFPLTPSGTSLTVRETLGLRI